MSYKIAKKLSLVKDALKPWGKETFGETVRKGDEIFSELTKLHSLEGERGMGREETERR